MECYLKKTFKVCWSLDLTGKISLHYTKHNEHPGLVQQNQKGKDKNLKFLLEYIVNSFSVI